MLATGRDAMTSGQTPTAGHFVDVAEAASLMSLSRRRVLDLARTGILPGHPIDDGVQRVSRFRLSELSTAISSLATPGFTSRSRAGMVRANGPARLIARQLQKEGTAHHRPIAYLSAKTEPQSRV